MSRHLKRYNAPTSWTLLRKTTKFVTKPSPGPHGTAQAMPLSMWLRTLGLAKTQREIKKILQNKKVLVDGRRVLNQRFPVGMFDILSIPEVNLAYHIGIDTKGRLTLEKLEGAALQKPCQIIGKTVLKNNKIQIHLYDSRNISLDKNMYCVGDTIVVQVPEQKVVKHIPLAQGSKIILVGGSHVGTTGMVEKIEGRRLWCKSPEGTIETRKQYAYPIP